MKRMLLTSLAGFSLMTFSACSQMGVTAPAGDSAARPVPGLGAAGVAEAYARGRQAQAAGQWRRAADEFRRVIAADPRHLEASNALAVAHAEAGQLDESLPLFRRAIELAPRAAHIHNNYGYALYRLGRLDEAEQALRIARDLDPDHVRTRQNLALVSEAQATVAALTPAVASAAASPGVAPQLTSAPDSGLTLVPVEPQVFELRDQRVATAPAPRTAVSPAGVAEIVSDGDKALVALRFTPRQLGLEIANGVGVPGLARRTAKQLGRAGLPAVRLTNVERFQEATTVIQYRSGHEAAAQALGGALPIRVARAGRTDLRADINVRLVLGHDTSGRILAGVEPPPVLSDASGVGWRWS